MKVKTKGKKQLKDLCMSLFRAKNAEEIHKVVMNNPLLSDPKNWKPYGGNDNNYATFENQQSDAVAALVEKITNSIDAILTRKCKEKGIHPEDPVRAPKTMDKAVEEFLGIGGGNWAELDAKARREFAENIQILSTGDKQTPNIMIYDAGEGQHPRDFEDTFLSVQKGNKLKIPFVQGKYNMGSTGAVTFCGGNRYQLIVSKKANNLYEANDENPFGFTLVRRHVLTKDEEEQFRGTWYEYFTIDGEVPSFYEDEIDLGLNKRMFQDGTVVKLFSYELPIGSRSNIVFDLWRDLNQLLYKPAMPLLLVEQRPSYKGHSLEKVMLGNKTRIMADEHDKVEKTFSIKLKRDFGELLIETHVFKQEFEGKDGTDNTSKIKREFTKEKAVVFSVNGQVQGTLPRQFISQKLGLDMLRDFMLIHVDCSHLKNSFRQDLFMASRDRLKNDKNLEITIKAIVESLKGNENLLEMNEERKNKFLRNTEKDEELLEEVISSIPIEEEVLQLFLNHSDLSFLKGKGGKKKPSHNGDDKEEKEEKKRKFLERYYPEIFETNRKRLEIPLKKKAAITFHTDAPDDYFARTKDPGKIEVGFLAGARDISDYFNVTVEGPVLGKVKMTFEAKESAKAGEDYFVEFSLTSKPKNIGKLIQLSIVEEEKPSKKTPPKKQKEKNEAPPLPRPVKLFKDEWGNEWGGEDIVKLILKTESEKARIEAIIINMDSDVLHDFLKRNKARNEKQIKMINDKYFLNIYLHTMFLYSTLDNNLNKEESTVAIDELLPEMLKSYSMFLLSLNTDKAVLHHLKD